MKKFLKKTMIGLVGGLLLITAVGCGAKSFDAAKNITVISREAGSGTRGAFIELFGIEQKNEEGQKTDYTVASADINDSTGIMLTNVAGNQYAIGYVSLGALNDTIKPLKIDGITASAENIKNGSYSIARPFNIATKGEFSAVTQDFIDFILSADGQAVASDMGYIKLENAKAYNGTKPAGKLVVAGSSSVTPLMEKLKEAYLKINGNAVIEIQQSDSTSGMTSTLEGICDIGMASRDLKDSELEKGLVAQAIAIDGIAVIVNPANTVEELSKEQVKAIYTGEVQTWQAVLK